jgi:hypothetical protein
LYREVPYDNNGVWLSCEFTLFGSFPFFPFGLEFKLGVQGAMLGGLSEKKPGDDGFDVSEEESCHSLCLQHRG